jgi:phage/plasmid-associated DNA primase
MTYDLDTGELRESRRGDLMSRCVPVAASREPVPHPYWDSVLDLVMGGDWELVRYLRQSIGLLLTGDTSEKCFWFWVGNTNAGKTTILTFLDRLLGRFAGKIALRALLKRHEDLAIRHDLAELQGRRLSMPKSSSPVTC